MGDDLLSALQLPDRPMTEDELRGFRVACACLMRWGATIERQGVSLGGPQTMVPMSKVMAHGGRMVRGCAEAPDLFIGRNLGFRVAIDAAPEP